MTYLERYLAGEHEVVWDELLALGTAVREPLLYPDALAVARETMLRVRANIVTLIERLHNLGFQFGYEGRDRSLIQVASPADIAHAPFNVQWILRRPPVYANPPENIQTSIEQLEARVGLMPLSLYAWYETIGSVNFVGSFPVDDPLDPEGFNDLYTYRVAHVRKGKGGMDTYQRPRYDLEPLWVNPIDFHLSLFPSLTGNETPHTLPIALSQILWIAPSEAWKQGFRGARGQYHMDVPNAAVDGFFWGEENHLETFVSYLRRAIRYGGFPGLEQRERQPLRELSILTEGLLAF